MPFPFCLFPLNMKDSLNKIIGIDLGTTHSLVSHIKDGAPRIIPNERGDRLTPSVVFFREDGEVVVGELAKNQAVLNAERTVTNVKRAMGRDKTFAIDNVERTPAEISGHILSRLAQRAREYLGQDIADAVITVPAYFDDRQREDTLRAADAAGLTVRKLLNEPTAAALAYAASQKLPTLGEVGECFLPLSGAQSGYPSRLMVVDFGGGTLDITLVECADGVFRVRGVGGSTAIGGTDFDNAIVEHILADFREIHSIDLKTDRIALQQLIINAEKAKKDLSATDETRIMVPYITATDKGPVHLNMALSRETLERLIGPILSQIKDRIKDAFDAAGLTPDWVETAILVGGATRVPAVSALVRRFLDNCHNNNHLNNSSDDSSPDIVRKNVNPDEAVARGAAILAGILEGSVEDIEFHDVTPHDLGVEDDAGEFVTVLPRGAAYPAEAFKLFTNATDDGEAVHIHVLQQVSGDSPQHVSLGWFKLALGQPRKKGEANIDVRFAIDSNGLLEVSAIDLDTGKAGEIAIEKVIV